MKYFYTDDLSAIWMNLHFGMKYIDGMETVLTGDYHLTPRCIESLSYCERIYIHPDSLHLLEPQVGDMVTNIGMQANRVEKVGTDCLFHANSTFTSKKQALVIQRNSLAFIWPEREK